MTIKENLEKFCVGNGLWPKEAEKVVENYRAQLENDEDIQWRWNKEIDLPKQMLAVLQLGVQRCVLNYIDKEKPRHFAKPMFL